MGFKSFGQTTLLTEGWNGTMPWGWGIGLMGGNVEIYDMTTGQFPIVAPFEGARLLEFESHTADSGAMNFLTKTYPISTVGYTNIAIDFEWYTDNGYPNCTNEGVTVQYSTDNMTWNSAGPLYPRYSPTSQWNLITQPLPPAASGQPTLYIGFWFTGQHGNNCHMDIMHVTGYLTTGFPIVTTNPATTISSSSAILNGTVNANSNLTTVTFDYGLTTSYGNTVSGIPNQVNGATNTNVVANITGLQCGTLYHFRVNGANSAGTANGNDLTFTTLTDIPVATTNPATGVTSSGATLNGTVSTSCSSASVSFNWGLTTSYGNTIPGVPSFVYGSTPTAVSANLSGLLANQTYHYEVCATDGSGTNCGNDATFTTSCPSAGSAGPITGSTQVCQGKCGYVYSVSSITNATGYVWTISGGGIITSGGTTVDNTITVTWTTTGANTVCVNYNTVAGCTAPSPVCYNVNVNSLPTPTVNGPNQVCMNTPCSLYTTQAGMTNYQWSVSAGGTITSGVGTNSICVLWNSPGSQTVSVNYANANGCTATAPTVENVTINPLPVPTITGQTSICVNSGYNNYTTEAGMTNYVWTVSSGGIINYGSGTNQIQVSWIVAGPQTVSVTYTNGSGCNPITPTLLNVNINPLPDQAGSITGTATVCAGANGVAYSVAPIPNAITYIWTLPTNAAIASGAGTNFITVNFASNASSGDIIVYGNNICGDGPNSPNFPATVDPVPPTPVVTNLGTTLQSNVSTGNQWFFEGTLITGATSQNYVATQDGYYWDIVTLHGCSSDTSNHKRILVTGVENHSSPVIIVFPVPNDGRFNVSITTASEESFSIRVFDYLGVNIYEEANVKVTGSIQKVIDLRPVPSGVYTLIFKNSYNAVVKKIIVNKKS